MKIRGFLCVFFLTACAGVTSSQALPLLSDLPDQSLIRLNNGDRTRIVLYYTYISSFGSLQMFEIRFRDRNKLILPVVGKSDGWFTPKLYYASFDPPPMRRLVIPANGSIDIPRDVNQIASWVRWGGRSTPPCEIQLKLLAYRARNLGDPVEAVSDWQPGPCPRDGL